MTAQTKQQARRWLGIPVIVVAALMGVLLSPVPAHASSWDTYADDCNTYVKPSGDNGCDIYVRVRGLSIVGDPNNMFIDGVFESWGEGVRIRFSSGGKFKWHLYIPDIPDPSGTLYYNGCVVWGRYFYDSQCELKGQWNIQEGVKVYLEVCAWDTDTDRWVCAKTWGRS